MPATKTLKSRRLMAQRLAVLLVRITIGQLLARRAAVDILRRQIDEVLLAEAAIRLRARCHWLRQRHRDVGLLACQNLGAVEVAAIGDDIEMVSTKNAFRLRCDVAKLCPIRPGIRPLFLANPMISG